ncbi:MAG: hypothetical protein LBV19_01540 [Streptococcaceae bacterium]|jgi:hypothetical protein|nr:hypothetical protein [Streptococcaceae bacterium]
MYIKKLEIKTIAKTIRSISFNDSINIITTPENDEQGNNVGKSTVIDLIDIALGAKFDSKWKKFSTAIQKIINDSQVFIELQITDGQREHTLKVDLANKKYFVNGLPKKVGEYGDNIRDLLFEGVPNNIRNRKLIPRFLILELPSNEERVIRYLDFNSSTQNEMLGVYEATYAYFLNDSSKRVQVSELLDERNIQFKAEKKGKSVKINEAVEVLENSTRNLKGYDEKNNQIKEYQYLIDQSQSLQLEKDLLESEVQQVGVKTDEEIIKILISELSNQLPSAQEAFQKIVKFNQSREQNRRNYLDKQIINIEKEISTTEVKLQKIRQELDDYVNFSEKKTFDFKKYNADLSVNFKKALTVKVEQSSEVNISDKQINSLFSGDVIAHFNKILEQFTREIIGVSYSVEVNQDLSPEKRAVPLVFVDNQGSSTGLLHQLEFAFTAAVIAMNTKRKFPKFILQDINEVTDEDPFDKMFEVAKRNKIQFIAPILSSKLSKEIKEKYPPVLTLSNDDKLFEPRGR